MAGLLVSAPTLRLVAERLRPMREAPGRGVLDATVHAAALAALGAVLVLGCMRMASGTYNPFIYFRF
jgi:hypothetical protein